MFWLQEVTSGAQGLKRTKGTRYMSKVRKKVLSVDVNGRRKSQRNKERTFLTLAFEIKHPTKGFLEALQQGPSLEGEREAIKCQKKKQTKNKNTRKIKAQWSGRGSVVFR